MRSRYSAYNIGGYGKYLLATWLPATALGLSEAALSQRTHNWFKLEVLEKSQQGDKGYVSFNAWYRDENEAVSVMHERSVFKRSESRWYYVGAEVG